MAARKLGVLFFHWLTQDDGRSGKATGLSRLVGKRQSGAMPTFAIAP